MLHCGCPLHLINFLFYYLPYQFLFFFFFFNDTATTEIYTLSLHDALPISPADGKKADFQRITKLSSQGVLCLLSDCRSEEHTSELQSRPHLVCRLLLEKKKKKKNKNNFDNRKKRKQSSLIVRQLLQFYLSY